MSDHLKEFIQQHRTEFDIKHPDPKNFDAIMSKLNTKQSNNKLVFLPIYTKMIAAASIALFVTIGAVIYLNKTNSNTNNDSAIITTTNYIIPAQISDNSSHELNNTTTRDENENNANVKNNAPIVKKQKLTITSKKIKKAQETTNELSIAEPQEIVANHHPIINTTQQQTIIASEEIATNTKSNISTENKIENESSSIINQEVIKSSLELKTTTSPSIVIDNNSEENTMTQKTTHWKQLLRKIFFKTLQTKASQWTGDIVQISTDPSKHNTQVAIQYKSENLEINKHFTVAHLKD